MSAAIENFIIASWLGRNEKADCSKVPGCIGGENFFDGFGFAAYRKRFGWRDEIPLDLHEKRKPPKHPLLPFLEKLDKQLPKRGDSKLERFTHNDDWLLWVLRCFQWGHS